jgi:hypothetical protein
MAPFSFRVKPALLFEATALEPVALVGEYLKVSHNLRKLPARQMTFFSRTCTNAQYILSLMRKRVS